MSVKYKPIHWNRQKKIYDTVLVTSLLLGVVAFVSVSLIFNSQFTAETLIIRSTSFAALGLLHVILCIGPLARLDTRFLPLLYNRRHLGVTMFLLALTHATMAVIQFHALSNVNPLVSVFTAYREDYAPGIRTISNFPFEPFGLFALVFLYFMAATSHDFWLSNLGAGFWKLMHMSVYAAYGLILVHVAYGFLQSERSPFYVVILAIGFVTVTTLHLLAFQKEAKLDCAPTRSPEADGYIKVARAADLKDGRGKVVRLNEGRIGLFLSKGNI